MSGDLVRKQPERKAKKRSQESMANSKSKKFSKVPRRQSKSKMTMNPTSFDPIGELLSNYGEITGESLAHEIFSYLDFSTLQQIRLSSSSVLEFFLDQGSKAVVKHFERNQAIYRIFEQRNCRRKTFCHMERVL